MDQRARELLDLLHREADGDLSPAERERLAAWPDGAEAEAARRHLARAVNRLSAVSSPPPPLSIARDLASEVAWSARFGSLRPPPPSRELAPTVGPEVALSARLGAAPVPPQSVTVARTVAREVRMSALLAAPLSAAAPVAGVVANRVAGEARARPGLPASPARNPAPLLLVAGLLVGLTLLGITNAWPSLAAGAAVLQTLVAQVSPLAGVGLALLLGVSLLVAWRPSPGVQRLGAGAFALAAVLILPPLYEASRHSGVSLGRDVTVRGPVQGNVIALGGNVILTRGARVDGEVITLLGDVRRAPGSSVSGRVNALLGRAPGDATARHTPPPVGLGLATASAFRPLLTWLGGAAWSRVFLVLTGGALLLLFVTGLAPLLARRQRHAPVHTLALGVLALALLGLPALGLALTGWLVPALLATALLLLLLSTGLSVSAYDAGRALAYRLRLPLPDALGALLGLGGVAASLGVPPLALTLTLVGGAWGAGTLLLTRAGRELPARRP